MDINLLKPFDYFEYLHNIKSFAELYPFTELQAIGKSVMGREIFALTVGKADEYAVFVGGIHGCDSFTCALLTAFFDELCSAIENDRVIEALKVRRALRGRGLIVVPCLNPDGCEIANRGKAALGNFEKSLLPIIKGNYPSFRLNARGCDLENSFGSAAKQPESSALTQLLNQSPSHHLLIFSSGNGEILLPSEEKAAERSFEMAAIMSSATGYSVCPQDNPPSNSLLNSFCTEHKKPFFKIASSLPEENGKGYIGLYQELRELMMLSAIM